MRSKPFHVFLYLIIFCFSSKNIVAQKSHYIIDSIINYKLDNEHTFKFKFYYYDSMNSNIQLVKIQIFSNNTLIQTIKTKKDIVSSIEQELIDYNFDGYMDISVRREAAHGGWSYWIWKYSKKDNMYYYDNQLSGNMGLELDKRGKNIVFFYKEDWQHESWDTFKFVNDKLTWIKGLDQRKYHKGSDLSTTVVETR